MNGLKILCNYLLTLFLFAIFTSCFAIPYLVICKWPTAYIAVFHAPIIRTTATKVFHSHTIATQHNNRLSISIAISIFTIRITYDPHFMPSQLQILMIVFYHTFSKHVCIKFIKSLLKR